MNIHVLLILLLIFAITPNLGFFTFSSFFLISAFAIIAWIILRNPLRGKEDSRFPQWGIVCILFLSAYYYGGLYQEPVSKFIGQIFFFSFCIYVFVQIYKKREIASHICIIFFLLLSLLTIYGSPNPTVDTFVILKEAPQKLLSGHNPYDSVYSKVYKDIEPNYFSYLPLSIIYFLPFVYFLDDPRYGLIVAMLGTYFLLNRLQKKNSSQKYLYSSLFLFAPRSFYMLEHAYLDTLIFFLFVWGLYLYGKGKNRLFSFVISTFFLLKQNIIILLPLFFNKIIRERENIFLFLAPFLSIVFFFVWNPQSFIKNIITINQPNSLIMQTSPFQMTITVPNILFQLFHPSISMMQYIFIFCALVALFITMLVLLHKKINVQGKIILILFFGYFFSYHAFFNSYYLVLLFLLFDFTLSKE